MMNESRMGGETVSPQQIIDLKKALQNPRDTDLIPQVCARLAMRVDRDGQVFKPDDARELAMFTSLLTMNLMRALGSSGADWPVYSPPGEYLWAAEMIFSERREFYQAQIEETERMAAETHAPLDWSMVASAYESLATYVPLTEEERSAYAERAIDAADRAGNAYVHRIQELYGGEYLS